MTNVADLGGPGQRKRPDPAFISGFVFSHSGCCELQHSVGCKGNTWGWGTGKRERRIGGRNREKKEGENQTRVRGDGNKDHMVNEVENKGH